MYDINKDKEFQDAFNNAQKTFTMEDPEEVAADSKEQEEAAEEQEDSPDFQLPGINIRFLEPPPEAPADNTPPDNTPQAPADNTPPDNTPEAPADNTLPASDLHHPDDDPSFPDAAQSSDRVSVASGDEGDPPQFAAWRAVHHLMWIPREDGVYKGWEEYKNTEAHPKIKWARLNKPPRNRCALGRDCIHNYFTPHLPPKKESNQSQIRL